MSRTYQMRRRAERQEATRRHIVEAAVALHQERGVLATTITDIAVRAGVERATVYRHFPDERSLFTACTGHYYAQHPLPDPAPLREIADPVDRLRQGLAEIYAHHRRTEPMMSRTTPDLPKVPVMQEVIAPALAHWARMHDVLAEGWASGSSPLTDVRAVIGHAMSFTTWQSLVQQQGLDEGRAVEMMVALVRWSADGNPCSHTEDIE